MRYSYVQPGSSTPRRFRCQPDDTLSMHIAPVFVSTERSAPGYLQLSDDSPRELVTGAESEDEMGLFHGLYNGRRESNLEYRLNEYLRIGLEARVIHAS